MDGGCVGGEGGQVFKKGVGLNGNLSWNQSECGSHAAPVSLLKALGSAGGISALASSGH